MVVCTFPRNQTRLKSLQNHFLHQNSLVAALNMILISVRSSVGVILQWSSSACLLLKPMEVRLLLTVSGTVMLTKSVAIGVLNMISWKLISMLSDQQCISVKNQTPKDSFRLAIEQDQMSLTSMIGVSNLEKEMLSLTQTYLSM